MTHIFVLFPLWVMVYLIRNWYYKIFFQQVISKLRKVALLNFLEYEPDFAYFLYFLRIVYNF